MSAYDFSDMKILFYATADPNGLCKSYMHAAEDLNIDHRLFDFEQSVLQNINFGKAGLFVHQHFSPENWIQKINRHFVITAREYNPTIIISVTNAPMSASALLFLKSVLPHTTFVLIWPDSLLNFKNATLSALPLYDLIATYGSSSVKVLEEYGKTKAMFLPLAGDPVLHGMKPAQHFIRDIGFVGGWRPERQRSMDSIAKNFPDLTLEIHGPLWAKRCKKTSLARHIIGEGLRGKDMATFFNSTRMNINTIDDTNYPSANMRFFEIPMAGGLEIVSSCPEMEMLFQDRKEILYFNNEYSLIEQIGWVMDHADESENIRNDAYSKINSSHTYTERLKTLLSQLR